MKIRRISAMTLMEVLLSIGLLSILLFALLSNFKNFSTMQLEIAKLRTPVFEKKYFHEQMTKIFAVTKPSSVSFKHIPYSERPCLSFTYQAGVDPNPVFAGWNEGHILVTKDNQLIFMTQSLSHPAHTPKSLPLMKNVTKLVCNLDIDGTILLHVTTKDSKTHPFAFFLPDATKDGILMEKESQK